MLLLQTDSIKYCRTAITQLIVGSYFSLYVRMFYRNNSQKTSLKQLLFLGCNKISKQQIKLLPCTPVKQGVFSGVSVENLKDY